MAKFVFCNPIYVSFKKKAKSVPYFGLISSKFLNQETNLEWRDCKIHIAYKHYANLPQSVITKS